MGTFQICSQFVESVDDLEIPEVCLASEVGDVLWRTECPYCEVCTNWGWEVGVNDRIKLQSTK